jgi:hypothetical protein
MKRKMEAMKQPGYVAPVRKPGEQDEFNPTKEIFDTSERDKFCAAIVSENQFDFIIVLATVTLRGGY